MSDNRAISKLTLINIFGAVFSVGLSVSMAHIFGATRLMDVYFASQRINQTVNKMAQTNMIAAIFMPHYHQLTEDHSRKVAHRTYSVIINWMFIFSLGVALIFWPLAPFMIGAVMDGYSPAHQELGVLLFRLSLPIIPLRVIIGLLSLPFNAEKKFGVQEAISLLNNVIMIALLWALYTNTGVIALIIGAIAGSVVQLVLFAMVLRKMKFSYTFKLKLPEFNHWKVFRQTINTLLYTLSFQVQSLALVYGTGFLPEGYFAAFGFVQNIFNRTSGILLRPVSTVFFTRFSEARSKSKDGKYLKDLVSTAIHKSLVISLICSLLVITSGTEFLTVLWKNQKFGPESIVIANYILLVLFSSIMLPSMNQIYNKINITDGRIRNQFLGGVVVHLISALLCVFLIKELEFAGLVVVLIFTASFKLLNSVRIIYSKQRELLGSLNVIALGKWIFVSSVVAVSVILIFDQFNYALGQDRINDLLFGAAKVTSTVLGVLILGLLFRVNEILWIKNKIMGIIKR